MEDAVIPFGFYLDYPDETLMGLTEEAGVSALEGGDEQIKD